VAVEEAFKNLKGDLAIRPIFYQDQERIAAYIFLAFPAYCLHVALKRHLHALAPGLIPTLKNIDACPGRGAACRATVRRRPTTARRLPTWVPGWQRTACALRTRDTGYF